MPEYLEIVNDMETLLVPFAPNMDINLPAEDVSRLLDRYPRNPIEKTSWPEFGYAPQASFVMAYNDDGVFLKYYVREEEVRAVYRRINDPVYKDSCVDFFIAFDGEEPYYNLQFNCLGTSLFAYGTQRQNRRLVPYHICKQIRTHPLIKSSASSPDIYWELTVIIPAGLFIYHPRLVLKNQVCRGNFHKCGDELPKPHYVSWNRVDADRPDFHVPQSFGQLLFE